MVLKYVLLIMNRVLYVEWYASTTNWNKTLPDAMLFNLI